MPKTVGRDGGTRVSHVIQIMGYIDMPHDPDVTLVHESHWGALKTCARVDTQTIVFDKEKISEIECVDSEGKRKEKPLNKGRVLTVPK